LDVARNGAAVSAALTVTSVGKRRQVQKLVEKLEQKCARLYDARTPEKTRRVLSMEVAMLRCRLGGVRDPLEAMMSASVNEEEC
jgi:hypothetical protein